MSVKCPNCGSRAVEVAGCRLFGATSIVGVVGLGVILLACFLGGLATRPSPESRATATAETIAQQTETARPTYTPTSTATPTPTPPPTLTPTPGPIGTATTGVNLRAGPGTNYDKVGVLKQGDTVEIQRKTSDSGWYQVKTATDDIVWVAAAYVSTEADVDVIPTVSAPDRPTKPAVAPTASPTPVLEWQGVYIGMPADDVLKIHPKSEMAADTVTLGRDSNGLIIRWAYPGAYLTFARREGPGTDGLGFSDCYRVIEIQLRYR